MISVAPSIRVTFIKHTYYFTLYNKMTHYSCSYIKFTVSICDTKSLNISYMHASTFIFNNDMTYGYFLSKATCNINANGVLISSLSICEHLRVSLSARSWFFSGGNGET